MVKRNFKIMTALAITLSLSSGFITAHAATLSSSNSNTNKNIEHKINNNKEGFCNPIYSILENKLGFTKAEIDTAAKAGKTAFDLASQKGTTADQLKSMVFDAQSAQIDKMVTSGKLTKDKADAMKGKLTANMQNWDGSLKQQQHKDGGPNPIYSILENKLGFTKADIDAAAKAGKTAFDLASQKGTTADQLKAMVIDAKSQQIDKMVTSGKLTKDKADAMKTKLTADMQNWNGSLKQQDQHKKGSSNQIYSILENKLGFTKADIDAAAKAGKTAFDLASQKGTTADQLKSMVIDAQSAQIDKMVTSGKLTKDKADAMKAKLTASMQNWDGSLKQQHKDGSLNHKADTTKAN